MKHKQVIQNWLAGRPAAGNSMWTDGRLLYSYNLPVASYGPSDDWPIIWNYTAQGENFISVTTSKQITQIVNVLRDNKEEYRIVFPEELGETNA